MIGTSIWGVVGETADLSEISLSGTIVFTDSSRSLALFELQNQERRTLRVGQEIPGVGTLLSIGKRGVQIQSQGREFSFTFNDSQLRTGGAVIPQFAGQEGQAPTATVLLPPRVDNPTKFVVPDVGQARVHRNGEEASLDATPRPGQEIDQTVWDPPPQNMPNAAPRHQR